MVMTTFLTLDFVAQGFPTWGTFAYVKGYI